MGPHCYRLGEDSPFIFSEIVIMFSKNFRQEVVSATIHRMVDMTALRWMRWKAYDEDSPTSIAHTDPKHRPQTEIMGLGTNLNDAFIIYAVNVP